MHSDFARHQATRNDDISRHNTNRGPAAVGVPGTARLSPRLASRVTSITNSTALPRPTHESRRQPAARRGTARDRVGPSRRSDVRWSPHALATSASDWERRHTPRSPPSVRHCPARALRPAPARGGRTSPMPTVGEVVSTGSRPAAITAAAGIS